MSADLEELLHEKEWRKCRGPEDADDEELLEAFAHFCSTYWYIRHPSRGRILFELYDDQLTSARSFIEQDKTLVLKARQIGFSTLVAAYAFWCVYFAPDRFIVMLSKGEREAQKLLQKTKLGFKMLPDWMKLRGPQAVTNNMEKLIFDNESGIESLPSGNDPARGESVWLAILDELAFLPNPDEAWAAIEPITDVGGKVIALSTANGEGNIFHELWVANYDMGGEEFHPLFFSWRSNGRDDEWYERQKRKFRGREWQLWQEYPDNAEEAFVRSGNPVFDIETLREWPTEEGMRGRLIEAGNGKRLPWFHQDAYGELTVWRRPVEGGRYVIGADVAEGLEHGDYSSVHVIAAGTGEVCAHWHGHIDPDLFGSEIISMLGWWYNTALAGVEVNNHGLTTLKALQRVGYQNIYKQHREQQAYDRVETQLLGWRTTQATKPLVIDNLAAAVREREIDLRCLQTIRELRTYRREFKGQSVKMHGSPYDDRVMSLAIGWKMLDFAFLPEFQVNQKPKPFTPDWFLQEAARMEAESDAPVPIGATSVRELVPR